MYLSYNNRILLGLYFHTEFADWQISYSLYTSTITYIQHVIIEVEVGICTARDERLNWMYKSFNCASKTPLRVTIIDTPSIVTGAHNNVSDISFGFF